MNKKPCYTEHTGRPCYDHLFKNVWLTTEDGFDVFSGLKCDCGAFIPNMDIKSVINFCTGNRVKPVKNIIEEQCIYSEEGEE